MTKVIYAIRSKAHFSYHESSIEALKKNPNVSLVLAFDKHWSEYGNPSHLAFNNWWQNNKNQNVSIQYFPIRKDKLRRPLMWFREFRSFNNYCTRDDDFEFYRNRWSHYLKLPVKWRERIIQKQYRKILGSAIIRKLLTLIERIAPADKRIINWLENERPDVFIASPCNMRYSHETELVKAAKQLNIPTVIPVLSWDNTSTKGLFHIHPNRILAWHQGHKEECVKYHGIPAKKVHITGAPFFDKWQGAMKNVTPYAEFCAKVGLDPSRPFILYLGSSANIAPDETWVISDIKKALLENEDPKLQQMQILFRSHPANWKHGLKLLNENIAVWPREGTLPDSIETFNDFRDSLAHATCIIGLNTSGMLDAIINNKPVISPIIEKYKLTQEKAEHFIRMRKNGTLYIADDIKSVLFHITNIMAGHDPRQKEREAFTNTYIWPHGSNQTAGSIVARETLNLVVNKSKSHLPASANQATITNTPIPKVAHLIKNPPAAVTNLDTDVKALFENFVSDVEKQKQTPLFQAYLKTRDRILSLMTEYKMSTYWYEEVMGFDYMFDASPLIVAKIREHCYHITGERGYNYRQHHSHKAKPYFNRLEALKQLDSSNLFVPESPACGGFGHQSPYGLVNLDTLKFYEVLIGLDKAGFLTEFKNNVSERKAALEIGSGWGGFAYQFHSLFKNTTFFCIDLPPTLLFSAVYIQGACPDANIAIWGDMPANELFQRWQEFDFIFIPANKLEEFKPLKLDLTVNMCSFQEMTTEQVREYVHKAADSGCKHLYSLNRDRSHHNAELSLVSDLMKERYRLTPIDVLPTEYCTVGAKAKPKTSKELADNPSAYRHNAGELR